MAYTLQDLDEARAELQRASDRADNHRANNPDFGRADVRAARNKIDFIEAELKIRGLLPLTEKEKLEAKLDKQFPNAQSRQIVEYEGKRYQRLFTPADVSRSGKTVMRWHRWWEEVNEGSK